MRLRREEAGNADDRNERCVREKPGSVEPVLRHDGQAAGHGHELRRLPDGAAGDDEGKVHRGRVQAASAGH